jgi:hypothetical protein
MTMNSRSLGVVIQSWQIADRSEPMLCHLSQSRTIGNFVAYVPGYMPITRHVWTCFSHFANIPPGSRHTRALWLAGRASATPGSSIRPTTLKALVFSLREIKIWKPWGKPRERATVHGFSSARTMPVG